MIEVNRDGLAGALIAAGLNTSQLGRLAARHLLGERADPEAVRRLADSLRVTAGGVIRSADPSTPVRRDRAEAFAAALQHNMHALTAPRVWALRAADGCLLSPAGVLVVHGTEERAFRTAAYLIGAHGPVCAQAQTSEPEALFESDVDCWVRENYDDLSVEEREHAVIVDPAITYLRLLDCLDVAMGESYAPGRRMAVEVGLVRVASDPAFQHLGTPAAIALDVIELAHELAERRLSCDRLRDAPASTFDRWTMEAGNLSEAVEVCRGIVESTETA